MNKINSNNTDVSLKQPPAPQIPGTDAPSYERSVEGFTHTFESHRREKNMSEERRGGRITEEILLAEGEEREKLTEMTKSQRGNHLPGGVIREIPVMRRVMPGQVTLRLLLLSRFSRVRLCGPRDGSLQAPPSLGLSRQEHRSGLPFPSPSLESEK